MDCKDLHDIIAQGDEFEGPIPKELEEHIRSCVKCLRLIAVHEGLSARFEEDTFKALFRLKPELPSEVFKVLCEAFDALEGLNPDLLTGFLDNVRKKVDARADVSRYSEHILLITGAAKALVDIAMPYGYANQTEEENYLALQDVVYRWLLSFPEEYAEFRKQFKDTVYEIVKEKAAHDKVPEQFYVHSIDPESFRNRPLTQHIDFTIKPMIRSYMKHNNIGLLMDSLGFKPK